MKEFCRHDFEPVFYKINEVVEREGLCNFPLSRDDLRSLFEIQAMRDESVDEPILKKSCFLIGSSGLYFKTSYTIANLENHLKRVNLSLEGFVSNDDRGYLSDKELLVIDADRKTKKRVF